MSKITITADRSTLKQAVTIALAQSRVFPRTSSWFNRLVLLGDTNDLEVFAGGDTRGMCMTIPDVTCSGGFGLRVDASRFLRAINGLNDESVSLEVNENRLLVSGKNSSGQDVRFSLCVELFSDEERTAICNVIPDAQEESSRLLLDLRTWQAAVDPVMFCCDKDSTRYSLDMVYLDMTPERIECAATDSRRLCVTSIQADPQVAWLPFTTLIHVEFLEVLRAAIRFESEHTLLSLRKTTSRQLVFSLNGVALWDKEVERRFPRYRDVFPKTFPNPNQFVAGDLLAALRTVQVTESREHTCRLFLSERWLSVTTQDVEAGETTAYCGSLLIKTVTVLPAIFDTRFLRQFLHQLPAKSSIEVWLPMEKDGPWQFTALNSDGGRLDYILMPKVPG